MDKKPSELDGTIIGEDGAGGQAHSAPPAEVQAPAGGPEPDEQPPAAGQAPGSEAALVLRPAVRSMWFLFFGLLLGPAIMYFGRDPDGHPAKWVALSLLSLGLILHRLGLRYVIARGRLIARPWWGLGTEEAVTLANISEVRPMQGFVSRLVGCAHLDVRSWAADEPGLIIMGQPDGWRLARQLEQLAGEARRTEAGSPAAGSEADRGPG